MDFKVKKRGIAMTNKIRVKLWRIENVVLMKVLEIPEELRGTNLIFNSPNTGMKIYSVGKPELKLNTIFLNGSNKEKDNNIVCCECQSNEEALGYYNRVINTIEEFNNKNKIKSEIDDDIIDIYVTD